MSWLRLVKFEKQPVEVQDFRKIRYHFRNVPSVAFFKSKEAGGGIKTYILKSLEHFFMFFFIENHWRHRSVKSFMPNRCRKRSPPLDQFFRALLRPSIDPRLRLDLPQRKILVVHHRRHQRHRRLHPRLRFKALPLRLNVLMLYGNTESFGKVVRVYIRPVGMD